MRKPSSRLSALLLLIFAFALSAPVAVAQDDESLPDPQEEQQDEGNGGDDEASRGSQEDDGGNLPQTGLPALLLAAGGALLLSSGAVIRPARRVRRRYDAEHDEWLRRINPGRYGYSDWDSAVRDRRRNRR